MKIQLELNSKISDKKYQFEKNILPVLKKNGHIAYSMKAND